MATVCGVIERVNKLVYVRTLRARLLAIYLSEFLNHPKMILLELKLNAGSQNWCRYKPEVGDIIVGRVIEASHNRISYFC